MSIGRIVTHIGALATAVVLLGGCSAGGTDARKVEVGMKDMLFEPATIHLKASEPVRLVLRNDGKLVHDFTVQKMPAKDVDAHGPEAAVHGHDTSGTALHLALKGGQAGEIRLTPLEPGEYEYVCTEPGHREEGMRGILRVS